MASGESLMSAYTTHSFQLWCCRMKFGAGLTRNGFPAAFTLL